MQSLWTRCRVTDGLKPWSTDNSLDRTYIYIHVYMHPESFGPLDESKYVAYDGEVRPLHLSDAMQCYGEWGARLS